MESRNRLVLVVTAICCCLAGLGLGTMSAATDPAESDVIELRVRVNPSSGFEEQWLRFEDGDRRYEIAIRDDSADLLADHWELRVNGVLRSRAWAEKGRGLPSDIQDFDENGNLTKALRWVYKWSEPSRD